jgi:hypothetical protein
MPGEPEDVEEQFPGWHAWNVRLPDGTVNWYARPFPLVSASAWMNCVPRSGWLTRPAKPTGHRSPRLKITGRAKARPRKRRAGGATRRDEEDLDAYVKKVVDALPQPAPVIVCRADPQVIRADGLAGYMGGQSQDHRRYIIRTIQDHGRSMAAGRQTHRARSNGPPSPATPLA